MSKKKISQQAGQPCSDSVAAILEENRKRNEAIKAKCNQVTGEGSVGERVLVEIKDFPIPKQWLPVEMMRVPLVEQLVKYGSIKKFLQQIGGDSPQDIDALIKQFIQVRCQYDFPFWAATFAYIKPKGGGKEILFRISKPQRKLLAALETMRKEGKPIRLILLKARQWGGSTLIQIYMVWLQLVHEVGLNSLVVAHVRDTAVIIKNMFERVLKRYPTWMLHDIGEQFDDNETKLEGVGGSTNIKRIPQRDCMIKVGSAEKPDSARGDDYNLVHCSEVGVWKATDNKTPEEIVQSAISGVTDVPMTMIVYESTAKGSGNFFHREWVDAKDGNTDFVPLFVPWYEIPWDSRPLKDPEAFAYWLYENRNQESVDNVRKEPGSYLWKLWQVGATLEGINWYIHERKKHSKHSSMASECPTDDTEAFTFAGRKVFNDEDVDRMRPTCKLPKFVGEIYGAWDSGAKALENLRFRKEENGELWIWNDVEKDDEDERVTDRYLVVVDVCKGMSANADYAVIAVFDRIWMMDSEPPTIVAQWRGHIPMDKLAWKAAQIAEYYNHAFLVIESNTLETNNTRSEAEYILNLIRDVYDNLYARKSDNTSNDVKEKPPIKYGWHTNVLTKGTIINNLQAVVREGLYIERDVRCLEEYKVYVKTEKGGYEAPSGWHDDILMTRAIGMQVCLFEMDRPRIVKLSTIRQQPSVINEATM
jgi:hypothetical protein